MKLENRRTFTDNIALRSRTNQRLITLSASAFAFTLLAVTGRSAFAQDELIETIAENPGTSSIVIALISIGVPAISSYLSKRQAHSNDFTLKTIEQLNEERMRLVIENQRLEEEKDNLQVELALAAAKVATLNERVSNRDEEIKRLSAASSKSTGTTW